MIYILALILSLSLASASTKDRYIITYDNEAWTARMQFTALDKHTVYKLNTLKMTVAELNTEEFSLYESIPGVKVYRDTIVHTYDEPTKFVEENPSSWGLDRIDQRELPLDKKYHFDLMNAGANVDVYIIDTGVNAEHIEFGGRATLEKNFANDGEDRDCNGHGTHVSSTIGGTTVGVAKEARIHGVKVLACNGSGKLSDVIAGINYVVEQHTSGTSKKTVINMSLGGGFNQAINDAVEAATQAGVIVVVAAGNSADDSANYSPASAPSAITVAASDSSDVSAYFTNYGKPVDLYAPGVDIHGAWIGSTTAYNTISGTSMASPHVAGVAALLVGNGHATTNEEVKAKLVGTATKDVLKNVPRDTATILLHIDV